MELTKEKSIDLIEITDNGIIQVREIIKVLENGNVISSSYHRLSFSPGEDVSSQHLKIQAIAQAIWTEEVVEAYKKLLEIQPLGAE